MENIKTITTKIGTISVPKKLAKIITVLIFVYSFCMPARYATDVAVAAFCLYYALTGKNAKAKTICLCIFAFVLVIVSRLAKVCAVVFTAYIIATMILRRREKKES